MDLLVFGLVMIGGTKMAKSRNKKISDRNLAIKPHVPYLYLIPAVVVLLLIVAYPLFYGFYLSMTNMSLRTFKDPSFIGLANYVKLFDDKDFFATFVRTIKWTFINVFFHVTLGLSLAMLLNRKIFGKTIIRVLLIIPWAMPQYIAALTWRGMLNKQYGAINIVLQKIGIEPVAWLTNPQMTFVGAILTNIWLGFPFMMMIALGGLQSIPSELYEAAQIDGANRFQKFKNITLPLLRPVMTPSIILGTVWTFNMVNVILILAGGFGNPETQILVTEVYRTAFSFYRYGYGAAYSVAIFAILLVFGFVYAKFSKATEEVG